MASTVIEDPFKSRGGRGRGRGGRGRGRGGAPGRGRGGGKAYQDERSELELAKKNSPLEAINETTNTKQDAGAGQYGFFPTIGRGGWGPIGQCANRGFTPYGRGRGAPPPSMGVPLGFYVPLPAGTPFNGVLQGAAPIPVEAATYAIVTIPSPINTQADVRGYGGQNRGRGGGFRGGWFKGANGNRENNSRFDDADPHGEASNENRGGRGGYAPRGGFRGRGRGEFGVRTEADAVVDNPGAEDVEGEGEEAQVMGANALMGRGTPLRSPSSTTFHLPAT